MEIVVEECKLEPIITARHIVKKYLIVNHQHNIINYALFILNFN